MTFPLSRRELLKRVAVTATATAAAVAVAGPADAQPGTPTGTKPVAKAVIRRPVKAAKK